MFGQNASLAQPDEIPRVPVTEDVYCDVRDLNAVGDRGTLAVAGTSFAIRKGEILGVAGVSGNGQKQLVEVLAGQREPVSGSISVAGQPYRRSRSEMHRYGVFLLTEEPLLNGCVRSLSVAANLALRRYDQPPIAWHGWLRRRELRRWAEDLIVRYGDPNVVAARADRQSLGRKRAADGTGARAFPDVRLLVLQNPCFGLDAAAASEIRRQIGAARNAGVAGAARQRGSRRGAGIVGSHLVMSGGCIAYEVDRRHADRYQIGRHMARSALTEAA